MVERRIIDTENSAPLISNKKLKQRKVALIAIIGIIATIIFSIALTTGEKIYKIEDYTTATVNKESLISSTEASGAVVLPTQISIVSMNEGYTDKINVIHGDTIDKSTILAELKVPTLEQEKVDLENSIESQRISLEQIILSNSFTIKELEISIARVKKDIEEAYKDLESAKSLMTLKSSREIDYENALSIYEDLQNKLEDLSLSLGKQKKQGELNLKAQVTQIKQLELNLERVIKEISDAQIKSPISGDVLSVNSKLSVPGSLIEKNDELFTIADTNDVFIDLEVYEQYRSSINIGDIIDILISSREVEAEIIQVGSVASLSSDSLAATIQVRVKPINNIELTLGASAVANIPLGEIKDALTIPRGSYLTTGNQKYLYVVKEGLAYKTKVTYGVMEGNKIQILSGLKEGDKVIISSYQDFIDKDIVELKEYMK